MVLPAHKDTPPTLGIARICHSSSYTPSPGSCHTVDTQDMYTLLNMFYFSLPVLVAGKTLLPGSSVQRATPFDPSTAAFISASTPPLPKRHRPEFQTGVTQFPTIMWSYLQTVTFILYYKDFC